MITTDQFSRTTTVAKTGGSLEDQTYVLQILHDVRDAVGFASEDDGSSFLDGKAVWNDLKEASIPFLRSAAVFYHQLTGVTGPQDRLEHFGPNEHVELCKYLGLPINPKDLFAEVVDRGLARYINVLIKI